MKLKHLLLVALGGIGWILVCLISRGAAGRPLKAVRPLASTQDKAPPLLTPEPVDLARHAPPGLNDVPPVPASAPNPLAGVHDLDSVVSLAVSGGLTDDMVQALDPVIEAALMAGDVELKTKALAVLAALGGEERIRRWAQVLQQEPDPSMRISILEAIPPYRRSAQDSTCAVVLRSLAEADPDERVRCAARKMVEKFPLW
jgi:hypothetical protein